MSRKNFHDAWRSRLGGRNQESSVGMNLLALAAGVVVGVAAGAYLADRMGGLEGIKSRLRQVAGRRMNGAAHDHDHDETLEDKHAAHAYAAHHDEDEAYDEDEEYAADYDSENEDLEERVLDAFSNDPVLSERAVDIGAIGPATIELTGWVHTDDELTHAATIARGVPGVSNVVNELSVRADEQSPPSAL